MVHEMGRGNSAKANGQKQVLIMDCHNSHYGLKVIRQSRKDNVVLLGYPPHCTHVLQGLDVLCFGPFKKAFHDDIRAFKRNAGWRGLKKEDFAGVFGCAFNRVFTSNLIEKAFAKTGIHPLHFHSGSTQLHAQ